MVIRLLVLILMMSLLPASIVGWLSYSALYNNISETKIRDVGNVAESKHQYLNFVLKEKQSHIAQFLYLYQNGCVASANHVNPKYEACLRIGLGSFVAKEGALGGIIRRDKASDIIVGALNPLRAEELKLQTGQLAIFPASNGQGNRKYYIPVWDPQSKLQMVVTYPAESIQNIFTAPVELGASGESFLADAKGYFITRPRYPSQQGNTEKISAIPMQHCLSQQNMQMLELDYRSVPIIHGFNYIPEIGGGCIMAHIDQQEAFAPLRQLQRKATLIATGILLFILAAAFFLNRQITRPLSDFCDQLDSIKKGTEKVKFIEHGPTEILILSRAFSEMIRRLQELINRQFATMNDLLQSNDKLEEAQSHLLQTEKMASIGQLAAGVAHEINNPIGFVHSNLNTLEKYLIDTFTMINLYEQAENSISDPEVLAKLKAAKVELDIVFLQEDLRSLMDETKDGIYRVKQIVQNLKDFSHVDATEEWHFYDLHKGLDNTLNIVNNEIKYKANVVKKYGNIPEVECISSQINQVVLNLLVNAGHAIEEHGTITISTGLQGDEVWVEIADTGKGIKPEHLNKIFDPFFTTKPVGQGTGLGLSLSYGIIQKHNGRIVLHSEVDKGTTFRIWLPIRQPQLEKK
jgi:signal transduction histidine kinase